MPLYTVGHGSRSTEELVSVLRARGVERLVDVRRYPGSRRHPHLGYEALASTLPDFGVTVEWWGEQLGGRRKGVVGSRHTAWRSDVFRAYADHMDTEEFRRAFDRLLASLPDGGPAAVMCAETLWWRCHRRLIADALVVRGVEVVHLLQEGQSASHELHGSARRGRDGYPVYDVGVTGELPIR